MKNILLTLFTVFTILGSASAQVVVVSGDITSNTTWENNKIYVLNGFVYVTNNATLTIQPGTVIKGDQASKGSLIVTRGAKIIADGTASQPIVFTSDQPVGSRSYGDWGGLIILGKAPVNEPGGVKLIEGGIDPLKGLYGGTDAADNSGILRYVRVEFPGIAFQPNNEINGITFGGVGSGTVIDYVQVSYSGDDAFEWFGGTTNAKHLIAYRAWDDDFDTDFGFAGKIQFGIVLRDSLIADVSGSNGFESDNDANGSTNTPITSPVFSNITIVGPMINSGTQISNDYKRALHFRRNTRTSVYNSVFTGYPTGLKIDGTATGTNVTNNDLRFKNNIIAGSATPLDSTGLSFGMAAWFAANQNVVLPNSTDVNMTNPYHYTNPDFRPNAGSPLLSNASFTDSKLSDPFFTQVSYRGAFDNTDWTTGWANFNPQNTQYFAVGIDEISNVGVVKLFPNPASDKAVIEVVLTDRTLLNITIMDLQGRIAQEVVNAEYPKGSFTIDLDTGALPSGVYLARIATDGGSKTIKLLISK